MLDLASLGAPMSPQKSSREFSSATMRWCCSRRGRWSVMMTVLFAVFLGLMAVLKHKESLSTHYRNISQHYPWRPYLPNLPSIIHTPFKAPSNITLKIESGIIDHVPSKLKKKTPNFHLLMPSRRDTDGFCKTTLSAMLLDYPPPTVVNLKVESKSKLQWEVNTLNSTLQYLSNRRLVHDEDLVLVVDGQQSRFQLPSDMIVTQYKRLLEDANWRLMARYGVNEHGFQKFNQTVVFGAEKMCVGDDMACRYAPHSILPSDLYGEDYGHRIADVPAKFIDSKMLMGPAKDLRILYEAALTKILSKRLQSQTVQSTFATIFGEQQLRRDSVEAKPATSKLKEFFGGSKRTSSQQAAARLHNGTQYEFSIGLDYLHILFQPLLYCSEDELISTKHDNSTDLSAYRHPRSIYQHLSLPTALSGMRPPFWRPDLIRHNPSPNEQPAYINPLEIKAELDKLPKRKTSWRKVPLVQNTYTGAVPAILLDNNPSSLGTEHPPTANITWDDMWYSPYKRALLRNYFRMSQSPAGYHNSLVGGDRAWDTRGGHGGIWTASTAIWLPWGEVDGVCGSLGQITEVFADGKGIWMHEKDENGEAERMKVDDERERAEREKQEREKQEREKQEREKQEREKQEREKQEREKSEREKEEADREREKGEKEQANNEEEQAVNEKEKADQKDADQQKENAENEEADGKQAEEDDREEADHQREKVEKQADHERQQAEQEKANREKEETDTKIEAVEEVIPE